MNLEKKKLFNSHSYFHFHSFLFFSVQSNKVLTMALGINVAFLLAYLPHHPDAWSTKDHFSTLEHILIQSPRQVPSAPFSPPLASHASHVTVRLNKKGLLCFPSPCFSCGPCTESEFVGLMKSLCLCVCVSATCVIFCI